MLTRFLLAVWTESDVLCIRSHPLTLFASLCFQGDRNLIVGGEDATLGRYPYAVTLQRGFGSHVCMGSLIAPDIVLTAAHCGDMQEAHIGRDQVQSNNDISETFAIVDRRYHPRYEFEPDVFDFDYSIVKLIGESSITPIMLNRNPMFPGVGFEVTTVGWGLKNVSDTTSLANDLQEATVKAIDNEQCRGLWSAETVQDHMYCTTNDGMGVSCRGDSGAHRLKGARMAGLARCCCRRRECSTAGI